MRQVLVFFALCFVSVLLQTLVFVRLSSFVLGIVPQIVLIVIALFGISYGRFKSQFLGISAGFLYDLLSSSPMGYHVLLFLLISAVAGFLNNKVFVENIPMAVIYIVFMTFLEYLFATGIDLLMGIKSIYVNIFSLKFVMEVMVNAIFMALLFPLFIKLIKKLSYSWQQWERREG